jgi:hypothetical protein
MINEKEKNVLLSFIEKYKEIHSNILHCEDILNEINKKKDELTLVLKETREKENSYILKMKEKYGEDNINAETIKNRLYDLD